MLAYDVVASAPAAPFNDHDIPQDRAIMARIDAVLGDLRAQRRRAIRIVELGCGDGHWLIRTALRARALGFTAIEGRGIDQDPACIAAANAEALAHPDLAIGLTFEVGSFGEALEGERDTACDIILCLGDTLDRVGPGAMPLVARAMVDCAGAAVIATIGRGHRRCVVEALTFATH